MSLGMSALDGAVSSMSRSFSLAQASMSTSLERISSGMRFQKASDALADYATLTTYEVAQTGYESIRTDLREGVANMQAALDAANIIMDDLKEAKQLWEAGSTDAAEQVIAGMAQNLAAVNPDGIALISGDFGTIDLDPGTGTANLTMDLSAITVTAPGTMASGAEATLAAVDNSITGMTEYIGKLSGKLYEVESAERMADVTVQNANSLISAITEIDEAAEMANVVDQQIRQQAAISMLSQANMARGALSALYT